MKPSRPPTVCGLWKCPENVGTLSGKADRGMPEWEETPSFMAAPLMSTWQNIALQKPARRRDGLIKKCALSCVPLFISCRSTGGVYIRSSVCSVVGWKAPRQDKFGKHGK